MARTFNGTSDVITIGDVIDLNGLNTFTLFAWINPTTVTVAQRIISKWGGGLQYLFQMTSGSKLELVAHDASGHQPLRDTVTTLSTNRWFAVAARMNGPNATDMALFVNGGASSGVSSGSPLTGGIQNTTQQLAIGDDAGVARTVPFHGRIAHVAIWNVALGDFEMAGLGTGLLPPHFRPDNLQAYWPLNGFDSPEPAIAGSTRTSGTLTGTSAGADAPVNPDLIAVF